MSRFKVMTPETPCVMRNGVPSPDFEQATEVESIVCARHLMEPWKFNGCTVWRRRRGHWAAIFDTSGPQGDYSDPPAAWARVEGAQ